MSGKLFYSFFLKWTAKLYILSFNWLVVIIQLLHSGGKTWSAGALLPNLKNKKEKNIPAGRFQMLCCILFLSGFLLLAFAKRTLFHCFLPYRFRHLNSSYQKPTIMVTNDDGIDAPWLRSLVRVLVSTNLFHVLVCAPDSCVFFSFFMLINLYQRCVIFSLMLEILS